MVFAKGLIAHAAVPLALVAISGGLFAQAVSKYDAGRTQVRHALHLDWQPESSAPRSSGEIACWQRSDASVHAGAVLTDYRGDTYVQDPVTTHLRVVKLQPGFRLGHDSSDWMSRKLADDSRNAEHLP